MNNYPKVVLTEEGMRDGLQIERPDIPVADKIRLLDALSETGLKEIAVGSFVSPRWVPQMACIDELVKGFHPKPGVTYTATALNEMGRERLRQYVPPLSDENTRRKPGCICATFSRSAISIEPSRSRWRAGPKPLRRQGQGR
jgi:hydroxymethylglutaryl-CoA lyase